MSADAAGFPPAFVFIDTIRWRCHPRAYVGFSSCTQVPAPSYAFPLFKTLRVDVATILREDVALSDALADAPFHDAALDYAPQRCRVRLAAPPGRPWARCADGGMRH